MVAYPPLVATVGSNIADGTNPVTASTTFNAGDWIFVIALTSDSLHTLGTPSGPPVANPGWTKLQEWVSLDWGNAYGYYAKVSANWTGTISMPIVAMGNTGARSAFFRTYRYDARSGGLGAHGGTRFSGALGYTLNTTQPNSAIIFCGVDWNAGAWTLPPAFKAPAGVSAAINDGAAHSTAANWLCGRHDDAGTAGGKLVGLTTPTTWKSTVVAIEVLGDVVAPATVPNVQAVLASDTSATITWDATTDNVGVVSYRVYDNGVQLGADIPIANPRTYTHSGLLPATTHVYTVRAVDTSGNLSAVSSSVTIVTPVRKAFVGIDIPSLRVGTSLVTKLYVGGNQVWP